MKKDWNVPYSLFSYTVVSTLVISSNGTVFEDGKTYTYTCTAQEVRSSNELKLVWSTDDTIVDSGTTRTMNEGDNSLEDLTSTYTLQAKRIDSFINCNITGYFTQQQLSDTAITASLNLDVRCKYKMSTSTLGDTDKRML